MRHPHCIAAVLCTVAAVTACADQPLVEPDFSAVSASASALQLTGVPEAPARHLVFFEDGAPSGFEARVADLGGTVLLNHRIGVSVVEGLDAAGAVALKASAGATYVEAQQVFQLVEPAAIAAPSLSSEMVSIESVSDGTHSPANPAGALLFAPLQWNMRQVKADVAWASGRLGSAGVTVAILDTGIDYLVPDMAGRVDLSRSVSFEPTDDFLTNLVFPGRHPSTDLHFHGTNVATQVASNAIFFAGITSRATLMSVKVCSVLGGCHGVMLGLLHAIDNGADVINLSLGGWFSKAGFPGHVASYNAIMNYAREQGVTIVVAAGNDANDLDRQSNIAIRDSTGAIIDRVHVPSFFSTYCDATHVLCVAATTLNDASSTFTNYGRSAIDVAAPGGGSGSFVYSICPETSLIFNCDHPNPNTFFIIGVVGTSQSAPHVSGLAALAVEDVGKSPSAVRDYVRESADAIGGGNTARYGKGRINVARAVGAN